MKQKRKVTKIAFFLIITFIAIFGFNMLTGRNPLNELYQVINRQSNLEFSDLVTWTICDNTDNENIKILIEFNSDKGISSIKEPNGKVLNCQGKEKIAIDYTTAVEKEESFEITLADGSNGIGKIKTTETSIYNQVRERVENNLSVGDIIIYRNMDFKITEMSNETMTLACQTPTIEYTLTGQDGYQNCVEYLNNACINLFENDSRVTMVRSAQKEDYDNKILAQTFNKTYWIATNVYSSWHAGSVSSASYMVYAVNSTGLFGQELYACGGRVGGWPWSTEYSASNALCPIIEISSDYIVGVKDEKFWIRNHETEADENVKNLLEISNIDNAYLYSIEDVCSNDEVLATIMSNDESVTYILNCKDDIFAEMCNNEKSMTYLSTNKMVKRKVLEDDSLGKIVAKSPYKDSFSKVIIYDSNAIVGTARGRTYYKKNEGIAINGAFNYGSGAIFLLIGKNMNNVIGYCTYDTSYINPPVSIMYNGEEYYYYDIPYGFAFNDSTQIESTPNGVNLGTFISVEDAVKALLDYYYQQ